MASRYGSDAEAEGEEKNPIHAEGVVQSGNVGLFLSLDSVFYFFHFVATIVIAKICL